MARVSEIAEWLGVEGTGDAEIRRVSGLEGAAPDAAVFAVDAAALVEAKASKAGVILANAKLMSAGKSEPDKRILWVRDARYGFAVVAGKLAGNRPKAGVHPTAIVGKDVVIGSGTAIGPGAVLGDGVNVGSGCDIQARVTIYPGVAVGDEVIVQAGAVLG